MKKLFYTFTFTYLLVGFCAAQDISKATIQWNANQTFDAAEGFWSEEKTTLTTHGNTKIEWKDVAGNVRSSFQILKVVGEWQNVSNDGLVHFEVKVGSHHGTIIIQKDVNGTTVHLASATDDPQVTKLSIQSFQVL